jgi:hypothetical protein
MSRVSSAIYTTPESEIAIDPFEIPDHWPRAFGLDIRWDRTAALWGALDKQSDTIYIYSEHYRSGAQPPEHAEGILSRGKWIPGVIAVPTSTTDRLDGYRLVEKYRENGLTLYAASSCEESGILDVAQKMNAGRLKVFRTLENFFHEYRLYRRTEQGQIVQEQNQLMNCLRSLCVSGRHSMCTKPEKDPYRDGFMRGSGSWMA